MTELLHLISSAAHGTLDRHHAYPNRCERDIRWALHYANHGVVAQAHSSDEYTGNLEMVLSRQYEHFREKYACQSGPSHCKPSACQNGIDADVPRVGLLESVQKWY